MMSNQHICSWTLTVLMMLRHSAEEASLDLHEVAEDDAIVDGVVTVEHAYCVAAKL